MILRLTVEGRLVYAATTAQIRPARIWAKVGRLLARMDRYRLYSVEIDLERDDQVKVTFRA